MNINFDMQDMRNVTEANEYYKRTLQSDAMCVEALATIAMNHFYSGQPELALHLYKRLLLVGALMPSLQLEIESQSGWKCTSDGDCIGLAAACRCSGLRRTLLQYGRLLLLRATVPAMYPLLRSGARAGRLGPRARRRLVQRGAHLHRVHSTFGCTVLHCACAGFVYCTGSSTSTRTCAVCRRWAT